MAIVHEPEVVTPEHEASDEVVTRGRLVLRRFLRRKAAVAGLVVLVSMFLMAFIGPHLTKWSFLDQDLANGLQGPSTSHWFGTTQLGQDIFARTMKGLQKSLVIGLLTAFFSTGIAAVVGASAGYFGGWVDRVFMWIVDLLLVLPSFLIIAILSPHFSRDGWWIFQGWMVFVGLLAAFSWMITARIVRGLTLSLKEREFVQAARFMGVPSRTIIFRHLLPNMSSFLIIDATLNVGGAIVGEGALSYFGFGVQPPDVSLGTLIQEGTNFALTYEWIFLFPALALVTTVLAVNVMGDGLRDALDPQSTAAKARTRVK
ncbi:MAG TPA: ABC transporter permease [Acidimicrobiia bacterium]|nr:ABC transporter permease [Acidimicrobiia bacterium]